MEDLKKAVYYLAILSGHRTVHPRPNAVREEIFAAVQSWLASGDIDPAQAFALHSLAHGLAGDHIAYDNAAGRLSWIAADNYGANRFAVMNDFLRVELEARK